MPLAVTSLNITVGFRKTGIQTCNRHLFAELVFAFVTDRTIPENTTGTDVVFTLNANPPEDEASPLSPSLLSDKPPAELTFLQQAISSLSLPSV